MVNETIVLVILIILILFKLYFTSKESIVFSAPYLVKEYKKNDIIYSKKNKTLMKDGKKLSTKTQLNKLSSNKIASSKSDTSKLLQSYNIPVPKFLKWDNSKSRNYNIELINKLRYPLVVKPIDGTQGKDVFLDLNSINQVLDKIEYLLNKNRDIIIEEQIKGENYRILILNNEIIDILHRQKPNIIGDGKHNIKELIDNYNIIQKKNKNYPITNINYELLNGQGLKLESVPTKGRKIIISNVCNYHNGSKVARIPIQYVHPDNLEMFKKINKVIDLNLSGIDYMSTDITKSYKQGNGYINEVNKGPDMKIHYVCDPKYSSSIIQKFVFNLFK